MSMGGREEGREGGREGGIEGWKEGGGRLTVCIHNGDDEAANKKVSHTPQNSRWKWSRWIGVADNDYGQCKGLGELQANAVDQGTDIDRDSARTV